MGSLLALFSARIMDALQVICCYLMLHLRICFYPPLRTWFSFFLDPSHKEEPRELFHHARKAYLLQLSSLFAQSAAGQANSRQRRDRIGDVFLKTQAGIGNMPTQHANVHPPRGHAGEDAATPLQLQLARTPLRSTTGSPWPSSSTSPPTARRQRRSSSTGGFPPCTRLTWPPPRCCSTARWPWLASSPCYNRLIAWSRHELCTEAVRWKVT